jgi:monooxygenase
MDRGRRCLGYVNASWPLCADLCTRSVVRLLDHMERHSYTTAIPSATVDNGRPLIGLSSGHVQGALEKFPRQASATRGSSGRATCAT